MNMIFETLPLLLHYTHTHTHIPQYLGVVLFIILLEIVATILGFVYRDTIVS